MGFWIYLKPNVSKIWTLSYYQFTINSLTTDGICDQDSIQVKKWCTHQDSVTFFGHLICLYFGPTNFHHRVGYTKIKIKQNSQYSQIRQLFIKYIIWYLLPTGIDFTWIIYEFVLKRLDIKGRFKRLLCLITAKKASFP